MLDLDFHFNKLIWAILFSFFYIEKIAISKESDHSIEPTKIKSVLSKEDNFKPIENITFEVLDATVSNHLKLIVKKYIGFDDSLSTKAMIEDDTKKILKQYGYLDPLIMLSSKNQVYQINITEGSPCLVNKIEYLFKENKELKIDLKKGDRCNLFEIKEKVSDAIKKIRSKGYYKAIIALNTVTYSKDKTSADISLSGVLGEKFLYEIVEKKKSGVLNNFFSDGPFEQVNFEYDTNDSIKSTMEKFYQEEGFVDVHVESIEKEKTVDNTVRYRYMVNPGNRYRVNSLLFEGNNYFSSQLLTNKASESNISAPKSFYSLNAINLFIEDLVFLYHEQGFWDVLVSYGSVRKDKNNNYFDVTIKIVEGKRTFFGGFNVVGASFFLKDDFEKFVFLKRGDVLSRNKVIEIKETILSHYQNSGYLNAKVEINLIRDNNCDRTDECFMTIDITVEEALRFQIRTINFSGLNSVDARVLSYALTFSEGDWYLLNEVEKTRNNILYQLNVFKTVNITIKSQPNIEKNVEDVDLTFVLQEGMFGSFSFSPGLDLERGFTFSSDLSYHNILGLAHKIRLKYALSQEKEQKIIFGKDEKKVKTLLGQEIGLSYINPYLFGKPFVGSVAINRKEAATTIWNTTHFLDVSTKYLFSNRDPFHNITLFYKFNTSEDRGTREQKEILVATGSSKTSRVGLSYTLDTRNQRAWPTKGFFFEPELSLASSALGGEYNYVKWSFLFNHFISIMKDVVFAFSLSHKAYENITRKNFSVDESILPSSDRLFAGGFGNVRGFHKQIGPYVEYKSTQSGEKERDFIGGSRKTVAKVELRYLLYKEIVGLGLFIDVGNSYFDPGELRKFKARFEQESQKASNAFIEDNFSYSLGELLTNPKSFWEHSYSAYGLSVKMLTPLGSLDLSFSFPWDEPVGSKVPRKAFGDSFFGRMQVALNISTRF